MKEFPKKSCCTYNNKRKMALNVPTNRMGVSSEFFVAAHNFDAFIDVCHLGSEFALRRLDLPADWTVNSVQILEDRLLLLTRYLTFCFELS